MFKASLLKFVLGVAIIVICYAFPFFMMPVGSYSNTSNSITTEISFKWNGSCTVKLGKTSTEMYYKVKDKEIYTSLTDKDFDINSINKSATISNIYTIKVGDTEYTNGWGIGFAVVGFVLTAWGLIGFFVPKKRR